MTQNKPLPTRDASGKTIGRGYPKLHEIAQQLYEQADAETHRTMLPWDHPSVQLDRA